MVNIPYCTEEHAVERAVEAVKDGSADSLAYCLAGMPDKQLATLIATECLGTEDTAYLQLAMDTGTSLQTCRRADNGAQWAYERIFEVSGARRGTAVLRGGMPSVIG